MKLLSYSFDGDSGVGLARDDGLLRPDARTRERFPDLKSVLDADAVGEFAAACEGQEPVSMADIEFDPLIPNPGRIICVGINYLAHIKEMGREPPDYPWLFVRFADSQVGHLQPLVRPRASHKYDFEGELAVIIGKRARHVSRDDALDCVAGYSCFNDGSLRDFQNHGTQFTPGKNFHHSGSFGPWLVTADEIPDPSLLKLETRLNGELMQSAPVSDLRFSVADLIEYCSTFCELQPGDVISTGTPGGVGFARTPPVWLQPGDVFEVDIDGIGVLRNGVIDED